MAGYKHNLLTHKSFDGTQKLFKKALKRTNTFVPIDTGKVEGSKAKVTRSETRVKESSKRAGEELDRKSIKKQKVEDATKQVELKESFKMIPFDEDAVNTIPLATKQAPIVDYKITIDKRKIYSHITRADENNESIDMVTTGKRNTDNDCIVDSKSAMSKENKNSNSYSTSQISTSEEIDYDSPEEFAQMAKLQALTKTLIVKSPVPITNCVLRLANAKTWDAIKGKTFRVQIPSTMTFADVKIGKRNLRSGK
nr:hypothetical protein [Tanacetum cinerariifolium]